MFSLLYSFGFFVKYQVFISERVNVTVLNFIPFVHMSVFTPLPAGFFEPPVTRLLEPP